MSYLAFVGSVVTINHLAQGGKTRWLSDAAIVVFFAVVGFCIFHGHV